MKKIITTILAAICIAAFAVGFTACGQKNVDNGDAVKLSLYMPDGAPALAVAKLMYEDKTIENVKPEYSVVAAETIQTYVTGENSKADLAILPVNAASKLLGNGENYKMLGTVTHGNLFLLSSKYDTQITTSNIIDLKGKTVGVVNLANVPGLTFKLILKDNGIEYNETAAFEEGVYLKAIDATAVGTLSDVDYYVVSEPAASTRAGAIKALNIVGNLQTLYGGDNGYPQAVLVAKNSVIDENAQFIQSFIAEVEANEQWLSSSETTGEMLFDTVKNHLPDGSTPSMNANQLNNKTILANCAIKFTAAALCKEEVNAFISKLIGVNANAAAQVSDSFFYTSTK